MLLEKCKLAYPLVVSKFIDGGLTVFKISNQRKTDFYNDISFFFSHFIIDSKYNTYFCLATSEGSNKSRLRISMRASIYSLRTKFQAKKLKKIP